MLKQVIVNKKCGTITPIMCNISDNKNGEAVFIIKDEIGYIKRVNNQPKVEIRNGLVNVNNIVAFINIVNLNDDIDLMYEFFLDYNDLLGKEIVDSLCYQERIIFQFRDKYLKRAGQFVIGNSLKKQAIKYREACMKNKPWSQKDFEVAKFLIHERYEDVVDIWYKLGY